MTRGRRPAAPVRAAALAAITCLAGAAAALGAPPLSTAIYPEQSIPVQFSHQRHAALALQCVVCHGKVPASTDARDDNNPGHEICALCHPMQASTAADLWPPSACDDCHPGFTVGLPEHCGPRGEPLPGTPQPDPVVVPPARLSFSHQAHVDLGTPCLDCHAGIDQAGLGTREHLPSMSDCLSCHDGHQAAAECTTCHLQGDEGLILQDLGGGATLQPQGRIRPDDHGQPRWPVLHESAARADIASCEACHPPQDCLDCHDGVDKRVDIHPADWTMTHGLEAMRRSQDCLACHEAEADCDSCHRQAAVVPGPFPSSVSAENPGSLRFHPVGFAGQVGEVAGAEHHGHQARRSLDTCQACHASDEDRCIQCHSTGQVSPHPRRWLEDQGNWAYGQGDGTVCLRCHLPGDPNIAGVGR